MHLPEAGPKAGRPVAARVPQAARSKRGWFNRLGLLGLLLAAGVVGGYVARRPWFKTDRAVAAPQRAPQEQISELRPPDVLFLAKSAQSSMGLSTAPAVLQSKPLRLELVGKTSYDEESLNRVRAMFGVRVDKVHVKVGQQVKAGDPVIDVYSTELAEAKNSYEIEYAEWQYYKHLLETRRELSRNDAIAKQLMLETENQELKARHHFEVARDKLLIYGLSQADIEGIPKENGSAKARLTLRAALDGIVVERHAVPGNLYDASDSLLLIARMDELWVWGNAFESDADLLHVGQTWEIKFPYSKHSVEGKLEFVSNQVDPITRTIRVRASIPNCDCKLKADMLVHGELLVPAAPNSTVIPRTALVVDDGQYCIFVRQPGSDTAFQRRKVSLAVEKDDFVVIDNGVKPDELVVTNGSLMLAQIFDDLQTSESGVPHCVAKRRDVVETHEGSN